MTNDTAKQVGILISFSVNVGIAYLLGHEFHSFAIGYASFAVLSSLDAISLRLGRLTEGK